MYFNTVAFLEVERPNHRVGASFKKGAVFIPAIVGIPD
jgi:hypothetical protein